MRYQPLFMRLRHQHLERDTQSPFNLEFNDEHFAIATPEFWNAWRADKNSTRGRTISRQYAPAKYTADQVGQSGKKPVWVVFKSRSAKERFDEKLANANTLPAPENTDGKILGLGWSSKNDTTGMFFDDRDPTKKGVLIAWLNRRGNTYSVNVVSNTFKLNRPIPRSITDLGEAVDWVYQYSKWRN